MKKLYLLLLTSLIGGIIGVSFLIMNNKSSEKKTFTPAELWAQEINKKAENGEAKADKPDEFTKYFKAITTKFGQEENGYSMNYRVDEYKKAKAIAAKFKSNQKLSAVWEQRGPANVGGRTRGLIVDPDDATHNTWFAGAATGGVWKTTDGGHNWTCLTDDFPNLSANTIAMAESDHDILYVGTGESFPGGTYLKGNGVFKSTDRGATWNQLTSTTDNEDFAYVNRLAIDPTNADIVVVATESAIMKTTDGGLNWTKVYTSATGIEDLKADPNNFNNIYASENSRGILKSVDAGDSWIFSSNGISGGERFEIAVSPVNTSYIYVSQNVNSDKSYVYRSTDAGATWKLFKDKDDDDQNFLGGQGSYDNTIAAHPYNADIAFLGGVNLWKVDFSDPGTAGTPNDTVMMVDTTNTAGFLDFINFGGSYLGGGMEIGFENNATDLSKDDFISVEVRFGPGLTQKAHRFTVGGQGAGVPPSGYIYRDYVEVPFQVWDITNNKQLMACFRDQKEDGKFDLVIPEGADNGREYMFINGVEYSETASPDIAKDAGHSYKQLYFFWPNLATGATWDETTLPSSKIQIEWGEMLSTNGTTYNVSDAYNRISGNNTYNQGAGLGTTSIPGIHPDHHNLVMVPINEATDSFLIVNANDGGLGISFDSGITFDQLPNNYITTQFYGVAKRPGKDEYIGGMQDNGTWRSQAKEEASSASEYLFQLGGDGFEAMWHYTDGNKIIGSIYNNSFFKTEDGGSNWSSATTGITDDDGPFISRISSHKNDPNTLYAVAAKGIYKSTDFADNWELIEVGAGWNIFEDEGYTTSQHNVEVSLANEKIVWAGAAMSEANGWKIFVSTDKGESFNAVSEFADAELGYISGISTHPFKDSTAYLLFSFADEPKILRTDDLGQTWEDITGFVGNTESSNGFPDVVTNCLVVLPHAPNTIWAGTDIGLFESTDDGVSWHYANYDLPAVSIYDMFVQDGQIVIATHGRGVWTATIDELKYVPEITSEYLGNRTISSEITLNAASDSVEIYLNHSLYSTEKDFTVGSNDLEIIIDKNGTNVVNVISYISGNSYQSANNYIDVNFSPSITLSRDFTTNFIKVSSTFAEEYDSVQVYTNDQYHSSFSAPSTGLNEINVELAESNTYIIYIKGFIGGVGYNSNKESMYFLYVGIDKIDNNNLKVYPNPSRGYISIDTELNDFVLDVYSLNGSKVYSEFINYPDKEIDLNNLTNGTYIVKITKDNKSFTSKIHIKK